MNFNSTAILSLNGDNLANDRAFTKLISNLPINSHSLKKREIVTGKIVYRAKAINHRVVTSSNYSNGSLVGKGLFRLIGLLTAVLNSFKKRTNTLFFTFQHLPHKRGVR